MEWIEVLGVRLGKDSCPTAFNQEARQNMSGSAPEPDAKYVWFFLSDPALNQT